MTTARRGPGAELGYDNEVSAGWPALKRAACDWRLAVGEGLGVEDSWDPASPVQADKRGRKKSERGESKESEREEDRLTDFIMQG